MRMSRARARVLLVSLGVGVATAAMMLATEPHLAIVWDEGYTLGREARLRDWFRALRDPRGSRRLASPRPSEDLVPARPACRRRGPISSIPGRAPLRSPRGGLVLAVRPRGAARPSAVLCLARAGRRRPGPDLAHLPRAPGPRSSCSAPAGAFYGFTARPMGMVGRRPGGRGRVSQPNLFGHGHYAALR